MNETMIDPQQRWRAALANTYFASSAALLLGVALASFVVPEQLGNLAIQFIGLVPLPGAIVRSMDSNYAILAGLGFAGYAGGFRALQLVAILLLPISLLASSALAIVSPAKPGSVPMAFVMLLVGVWVIWWCFLGGDFYSAHDQDFTGMLRPPWGTFLYSMTCWANPLLVAVPLATLAKRLRGPTH